MIELLEDIARCHQHGIIHRDLKADNIVFRSKRCHPKDLVLVDFGHSRVMEQKIAASYNYGTFEYTSPELLSQRATYSSATDIGSLGVICYIM